MRNLVFATNNQHKLREVIPMIQDHFNIVSLEEIGCTEEIPETADTLEGNALLKAIYVNNIYGVDCFADDTGLEVEALNGRPGVYSARYAGEEHDFKANLLKVLQELERNQNRAARFRTVIALIIRGQKHFFEGTVNGKIIESSRGADGFGYDPIFIPEGYEQTFAEMTLSEKNKISHRSKAVEKLADFLRSYPV